MIHRFASENRSLSKKTWLMLAGVLLIATNLRAPFTSVAPVLEMIQATFGMNGAQLGLLTTLPLLAFGVVSPFSAALSRRLGMERALFWALILIAAGIVLRSAGAVWSLYLGTWLIGSGIAVGNVLLPALFKRDFPTRIAALTGAYAITMGVSAALGSAVVVPIADWSGSDWQLALGSMLVLPLAALALWRGQSGKKAPGAGKPGGSAKPRPVWRSSLAWQVTFFMGCNSLLYYVLVGWVPVILASAGFSVAQAGTLHGLMQLASAAPGLVLAPVLARLKDQRMISVGVAMFWGVGILGLLFAPSWSVLWVICVGAGAGASFMLALVFIGLRASNSQQAAALSGMAQTTGYLMAACAPPLAGLMHDASGNWTATLLACVVVTIAIGLLGLLAGRSRQIPL